MINIRHALIHLLISDTSPAASVQDIRAIVDAHPSPRQWITTNMIAVFGVDTKLVGVIPARAAMQYAVTEAVKNDCDVADVDLLISASEEKATRFVTNPANQPYWAGVHHSHLALEVDSVTGMIARPVSQVSVQPNGNASKRGSKQIRAEELFIQLVVKAERPLTNQEFVAVLMSDPVAQMTKAGATTYRYNLAKKFQLTS